MSLKQAPYYSVVCDYPGCIETAQDGDYSAWADPQLAYEEASDADWLLGYGPEQKDYCFTHTVLSSDIEDEEVLNPAPETFEWRITDAIDLKLRQAHQRLDYLASRLDRETYRDRERTRYERMLESNRIAGRKFATPITGKDTTTWTPTSKTTL